MAPRTLSPPPPATASAPNLDLQQLEEAWTLRMEQPVETLERMVTKISDADAEAYAANFVTFSSAKGKPEDFYARAAKQVVDARKEWLVLLQQLGLDS